MNYRKANIEDVNQLVELRKNNLLMKDAIRIIILMMN